MSVKLGDKLSLRLSAFHLKAPALLLIQQNADTLRTMLAPIAYGFRGLVEGWPDLQPKLRTGALYDARMRHAYVLLSGVFADEYLASVEGLARACVENDIDHIELMLAHSLTGQELLRLLDVDRPEGQPLLPAALPGILSRVGAFDLINLIECHREIARERSPEIGPRSNAA